MIAVLFTFDPLSAFLVLKMVTNATTMIGIKILKSNEEGISDYLQMYKISK